MSKTITEMDLHLSLIWSEIYRLAEPMQESIDILKLNDNAIVVSNSAGSFRVNLGDTKCCSYTFYGKHFDSGDDPFRSQMAALVRLSCYVDKALVEKNDCSEGEPALASHPSLLEALGFDPDDIEW